jgi:hypothetical protein
MHAEEQAGEVAERSYNDKLKKRLQKEAAEQVEGKRK